MAEVPIDIDAVRRRQAERDRQHAARVARERRKVEEVIAEQLEADGEGGCDDMCGTAVPNSYLVYICDWCRLGLS